MKNVIKTESAILDAISLLNDRSCNLVVVLDDQEKVIGTITDGDVRRGLLKGCGVTDTVDQIMNDSPFTAFDNESMEILRREVLERELSDVPIVDSEYRFIRVANFDCQNSPATLVESFENACAVIMAGGKGMRLRPITEKIPKPMVEVDGRPLLQHLVEELAAAGIKNIFISVNYLSHIIENYFGDGSEYGVNITYLRETEELGTAGAVTNLPKNRYQTILSINGDILSKIDFKSLYEYHRSSSAKFTVCTTTYDVEIPYGVLEHNNGKVETLREKPTYSYLCNAGIYLFDFSLLGLLTPNAPANMTDLIERALKEDCLVNTFPLHEYWSDVGTPHDLQKVRALYEE